MAASDIMLLCHIWPFSLKTQNCVIVHEQVLLLNIMDKPWQTKPKKILYSNNNLHVYILCKTPDSLKIWNNLQLSPKFCVGYTCKVISLNKYIYIYSIWWNWAIPYVAPRIFMLWSIKNLCKCAKPILYLNIRCNTGEKYFLVT